jgi:hypothetical protein
LRGDRGGFLGSLNVGWVLRHRRQSRVYQMSVYMRRFYSI